MSIQTIFFDLDDTLYPPSCGVWPLIRERICLYMHERLNIAWETIPDLRRSLFEKYGTTGRGLRTLYGIDEEEYLVYVHDVPVEERLEPDPCLRQLILSIPQRRLIFTNASLNHAQRVLSKLDLADCFEQIIDIRLVSPSCKPQPEAYQKALQIAGETDPTRCLVVDDSPPNLQAARSLGCRTILVGSQVDTPGSEIRIPNLMDLPQALRTFVKG